MPEAYFFEQQSPDATIALDCEGKVLYWNSAAALIFGFAQQETLGMRLLDLTVPSRFIEEEEKRFQDSRNRDSCTYECLRRHKDGSLLNVAVTSRRITSTSGALEYVVYNKKDITSLQASRDAKMMGTTFRGLLESTPDAIVMINSTGRIILINEETEKVFGYSRGELVGQCLEQLLPERHAATHRIHRSAYFSHPRKRRMGAGLELRGRKKDGSEFPVEISLSTFETAEGMMAVSAIRDATERKQVEAKLHLANKAKTDFLAHMSHELRTPLNAVIGFAQVLVDEVAGPLLPRQREFMGDILTSAEHLLNLINDILDISKVEAGKMVFHPIPFEIRGVVEEALSSTTIQAQEKRINFELQIEPPRFEVCLDPRRLKQVLLNLLSNAIKFSHPDSTVYLKVHLTSQRVLISVTDTGIGIREADLTRLFREFEQLDAGSTWSHKGSGLGLSLTRKLVEAQGGEIEVESQLGQGSTFSISLPRFGN